MIRPININLNAAHPELKLLETVTYTGSPSSVFIRGIPPNYGRWAITAVFVAASFPDGSTTTRAAVQSANGVWVATLPATATSGRTENGFRVIADGIDENGEVVTGYIIAVADFAVASLDVTPAPEPGETSYQMLYFDEVPSTLRKGDVTKIDGVLKFYNGSAWEPFAAPVTLDNAVTRTSANGVKSSGIWSALWGALSALPTGFSSLYDWCVSQLAGKEPLFQAATASGTTIKTIAAIVKDGQLLKPIDIPTSGITVNDKALSSDVTLTGADIAVSGTDATKIDAALAGKASTADATLNLRGPNHDGFSAWNVQPVYPPGYTGYIGPNWDNSQLLWMITYTGHPIAPDLSVATTGGDYTRSSLSITFGDGTTATRTALQGYQLGSQTTKPVASEAEAEALRTGKANRASPATAGNLAALDSNGNPTDSGKKAGDFATAAQGTKADTAIQGVKVNGTALTPDANKAVNVQVPSAGSALPLIAGVSDAGSSPNFSREDHVHPAETAVLPLGYALPASAFPVSYYGQSTSDPADIMLFEATAGSGYVSWLNPFYGEVIAMKMSWQGQSDHALAAFNKSSGAFINGDGSLSFNGNSGVEGVSPVLTARDSTVIVRGVEVASRVANPTAGNLAALDASGNPVDSGVKASDKLDSTSAAPAFSSDSTVQYAVGSHVTYNGKLYVCMTATTGGTWVAGSWTADTMTDPDAVLDVTSQNQLRVVAKDGTLLWAQGYDLASTSSATLACDAVNNFTFADGATSQAFALPTAPSGKAGDFGLDIDNSANTGAATMTLTGLDTTFSVVVPEGESLNDMLAIAAGELARFYISLSTFRVNNLPTWHIVKQIVENGGAQS